MNDIDLQDAIELATQQYQLHLKKKRKRSRKSRLRTIEFEINSSQITTSSFGISPKQYSPRDVPSFIEPVPEIQTNDLSYFDIGEDDELILNIDMIDQISASNSSSDHDEIDDTPSSNDFLHPYTDTPANTFCYQLVNLFRQSQLSKTQCHSFVDLIHSALPQPNNLPLNMNQLLSTLQLKVNFFKKRKVCLLCYNDLAGDARICLNCPTSADSNIAIIYDSDLMSILSILLKKLWKTICTYKEELRSNNDVSGDLDIGFAYAYQNLLRKFPNENFITALMHLDGVGLCKSNKLKMWLLSFSLIELPAKVRYQRYNMPVVSIWVSSKEPIASVWLGNSIDALKELKVSGIVLNDEIVKLKVLAVTGDSPALKIALDFIAHNGYYCCYFCYLPGIHQGGKRQYPYQCPHVMRTPGNFARDSSTAAQLKSNEKGHLGVSIFSEILDIKLPYSTIIDYAHASLLRHSKSMFVEIYRRLSPVIRATIDIALSQQSFPHFFHRRMKSFKDLSFIKATEIRNILFYGFLPIFHQHLQHDYLGHFALYICAMRLFHGRAILGPRTSDIANDLIMKYYQDFSSFYDGLENFVLHLHSHYERQYRMYGTFSHLGSFGQESLIGYIGSNRTGTTHHGDNICENYGIDLMLHHQIENLYSYTNIVDGPFDPDLNFDFKSNDSIIDFHNIECNYERSNSNSKKIYTPTTNAPEPECFLCRIIDSGEYVIVQRSSMKRIYDDSAEIMVYGRRTEARIEHRASKTSTKTFAPQRKRTLVESSITINSRSSISPKKTKHNDFEKEIQVLPNDILNDEENNKRCLTASSTSSIIQHIDTLFSSVRRENEKQFKELSKKNDRKHNIDSIDLSAFREPGNDQPRDDVVHDNVNLLRIRGKNVGDYGRQVLRCLYSREELLVSILPPGGTQFSRKPLDIVRFEKFHDAMRGKYRIADHYYDEFYNKLVRPKLVDFLSDERKRERQKQSTNSLSSQSSSPDHNLSF
ncbi:unnamed protein product [Rotaria magnacalcarata]